MARYIDADELLQKLPDDLPYKASVKRVLMQAPTADVVEVVRCKECQGYNGHREKNYERIKSMNVEELAKFMNECGHDFPPYCNLDYTKEDASCDYNCLKCAKAWLESEVE